MRVGFLSRTLIISLFVAALAGFAQQAFAMQITFVQAPQNRNQTQTQEGLPPEKKKSLSRYGPEDVFPGATEQEENRNRKSQPRRNPQTAPASRPAPAPKQSATPVATLSATPSVTPSAPPSQPDVATPSPTIIIAALDNQGRQPPLAQQATFAPFSSKWTIPVLSGLAVVVSAALIYVLTKLREKIRVGASG